MVTMIKKINGYIHNCASFLNPILNLFGKDLLQNIQHFIPKQHLLILQHSCNVVLFTFCHLRVANRLEKHVGTTVTCSISVDLDTRWLDLKLLGMEDVVDR